MRQQKLYHLITKMHHQLNKLIEKHNYNLLSMDVLQYSHRMDKVLSAYHRTIHKM